MLLILGLLGILVLMTVTWQNRSDTNLWMRETWNLGKMIFPYLVVGVFAAGVVKEILPPEYVSRYVGGNSISANFVASLAGAFMYFATLTEVPIVESLMSLGMGKGPETSKTFYSAADTGFIAQNVYLFSASEGLGACVRGLVNREALAKKIGLGPDQRITLGQSVGYPK